MTGNDNTSGPNTPPRNPWGRPQEQGGWNKGAPRSPQGSDLEDMLSHARNLFGNGADGPRAILMGALAIAVLWAASGIFRLEPGENAVIQRFGAISRTQEEPGLGYRLPWPIESLTKINVMLDRRTQIGFADSAAGMGKRDIPEESLMLTADANIVDIDVVVLWNITQARDFLFSIRNPEFTIKRVAESAIREAVGQTNLQTIITQGRDDVAVRIQKLMQSVLDSYKSGVSVKQVLIQEATVHPEVLEAYNDVAAARQDAERYKNEAAIYRNDIIPKARGQAIQMLQDAQAYKQDVIARATGDAQRFAQIMEAYNAGKEVTRARIYTETMEKVLGNTKRIIIDQKGGTNGVLPLLQLEQGAAAAKRSTESPKE